MASSPDQGELISGTTRLAAVIGSPVRHSLSPLLHNTAFAAAGLDWAFVAFEVAPGSAADALTGVRALGIEGLSVTMPHKADVADACDRLMPEAARLRAVNCVERRGDELIGHNTDGGGLLDALRADLDIGVDGLRCVVVGAGGAARAVIAALGGAGAAEVVVVNRSAPAAVQAALLAGATGRVGTVDDIAGADLVVQTTPVGMGDTAGTLPFAVELLGPHQVLVDIVVHPIETALVVEARRRGLRATGGLGMLTHQAARAFTIWTGYEAPVAEMQAAARRRLTA